MHVSCDTTVLMMYNVFYNDCVHYTCNLIILKRWYFHVQYDAIECYMSKVFWNLVKLLFQTRIISFILISARSKKCAKYCVAEKPFAIKTIFTHFLARLTRTRRFWIIVIVNCSPLLCSFQSNLWNSLGVRICV